MVTDLVWQRCLMLGSSQVTNSRRTANRPLARLLAPGERVVPWRPFLPGALGAIVSEVFEDALVGPLVGHEHRVPVRQGLGYAPELVGSQTALFTTPDERPPEGDGLDDAEVCVDVFVHNFDDAGEPGDGVPPEGLLAQCGDQPLLSLYSVQVTTGGTPVAGVGQCFQPSQLLPAGGYIDAMAFYADPYGLPDIHCEPAQDVYHVLETPEVNDGVTIYGDVGEA